MPPRRKTMTPEERAYLVDKVMSDPEATWTVIKTTLTGRKLAGPWEPGFLDGDVIRRAPPSPSGYGALLACVRPDPSTTWTVVLPECGTGSPSRFATQDEAQRCADQRLRRKQFRLIG